MFKYIFLLINDFCNYIFLLPNRLNHNGLQRQMHRYLRICGAKLQHFFQSPTLFGLLFVILHTVYKSYFKVNKCKIFVTSQ
ncbi:hypothetical protein HMPREF3226_00092 [Prevotella corporis]|uniref:Uncharacterized protein n=1 Tax=Prevotella corporis TaxID=28128 RepID=A0A133QQG0_9BACT|nr:hypothetical protein HMPREF3226_00092 [Prevotella corporis]